MSILYNLKVLGTGCYRPAFLTSTALDRKHGLSEGEVERQSFVHQRPVETKSTVIEMLASAASEALAAAHLEPGDLDCIMVASALPHQGIPTTAAFLQRALGLIDTGIPAFDINATCLGLLAALDVAGALIRCGRYRTILLASGDLPSKGLDWSDPSVAGLFGDGAAAMIVGRAEDGHTGVLATLLRTYSESVEACEVQVCGTGLVPQDGIERFMAGWNFRMDGPQAYKTATRYMPQLIEDLLAQAGMTMADIGLVVPHQANAVSLEHMRRKLGVPNEKLVDIFRDHGNQVSASLPTALHRALTEGRARPGDVIMLVGTAAGITIGGAIIRL